MKPHKRSYYITAYALVEDPPPIVAGSRERHWMDETPDHFAYRCLPLSIVNQLGWDILCPCSFTVRWNGKVDKSGVDVDFDRDSRRDLVGSHFGSGVLTFTLGYLFRTTPRHNLWAKGPTNLFKDGIVPLEGIIETDWAPYTFTMNWKITRPKHKIRFEKGEPICRIVPYPCHYLAEFEPRIQSIHANAAIYQQYVDWRESRTQFIAELGQEGSEAHKAKWQRAYMRGVDQQGRRHEEHETKLRIREFERK